MPPSSTEKYRKPRADLYTAMLFIALVAVAVAIAALYAFMTSYGFELRAPSARVATPVERVAAEAPRLT